MFGSTTHLAADILLILSIDPFIFCMLRLIHEDANYITCILVTDLKVRCYSIDLVPSSVVKTIWSGDVGNFVATPHSTPNFSLNFMNIHKYANYTKKVIYIYGHGMKGLCLALLLCQV